MHYYMKFFLLILTLFYLNVTASSVCVYELHSEKDVYFINRDLDFSVPINWPFSKVSVNASEECKLKTLKIKKCIYIDSEIFNLCHNLISVELQEESCNCDMIWRVLCSKYDLKDKNIRCPDRCSVNRSLTSVALETSSCTPLTCSYNLRKKSECKNITEQEFLDGHISINTRIIVIKMSIPGESLNMNNVYEKLCTTLNLDLQFLSLSHNNISHLSSLPTECFPNLVIVDVSSNQIKQIDVSVFKSFADRNITLYIGLNPFDCRECKMQEFLNTMLERYDVVEDFYNLTCADGSWPALKESCMPMGAEEIWTWFMFGAMLALFSVLLFNLFDIVYCCYDLKTGRVQPKIPVMHIFVCQLKKIFYSIKNSYELYADNKEL